MGSDKHDGDSGERLPADRTAAGKAKRGAKRQPDQTASDKAKGTPKGQASKQKPPKDEDPSKIKLVLFRRTSTSNGSKRNELGVLEIIGLEKVLRAFIDAVCKVKDSIFSKNLPDTFKELSKIIVGTVKAFKSTPSEKEITDSLEAEAYPEEEEKEEFDNYPEAE